MGAKFAKPPPPPTEEPWDWMSELSDKEKALLKKVQSRAKLYDTGIDLGFTKVGLDPILGLVPGVGDFLTSALALKLVFSCADSEVPRGAIHKMYFNVILDFSLGFIPIVGDVGDFMFKCNDKNAKLFEAELLEIAKKRKKEKDAKAKDAIINMASYKIPPPPPIPASAGGGSLSRV